jgi:methionyl-tRNA formyltransferase
MKKIIPDISLLMQPSMRSIAYLRAFESLGILPAEVILLEGAIGNKDELKIEDELFGYSVDFFNIDPGILDSLDEVCSVTRVASNDINGYLANEAIQNCSSRYIVFSASGILNRAAFSLGKRFIHVHPGLLPQYRGSTCFYYSLLENGSLGSTAFFMDEQIDTGEIIAASKFSINYDFKLGQRLFMDYILDPYIRYVTLKKVLAVYLEKGGISGQPQTPSERPAYYIMHPVLRRLATDSLINNYDVSKPEGVFEAGNNQVLK